MKKQLIVFTFLILSAGLVGSNISAQPLTASTSFDFPSEIIIGDTVDINAQIDLIGIDSMFYGVLFDITISIYNDFDTLQLCEGSVELLEPGTLIYQFNCEIPDTLDLGNYSILIVISSPFGDYVISQGSPVLVQGDHDLNDDGSLDISDMVYLVEYMFNSGEPPHPGVSNADLNCDQNNDISDLITMVRFMFEDGLLPCYGNRSH